MIQPYFQDALDKAEVFEGEIPWMYRDSVGKVTVGVGLMLQTELSAGKLQFVKPDKSLASLPEIVLDFKRVLNMPYLDESGQAFAAKHYFTGTALTLPTSVMTSLLINAMTSFEAGLRRLFTGYDTFPGPAKTGLLHMIYNLGERGLPEKFPRFCEAVRNRQWNIAALECQRPQLSAARNIWTTGCFTRASNLEAAI